MARTLDDAHLAHSRPHRLLHPLYGALRNFIVFFTVPHPNGVWEILVGETPRPLVMIQDLQQIGMRPFR